MQGIRIDRSRNSIAISEELFQKDLFEFPTNDYAWDYRTRSMRWVSGKYEIYSFDKKSKEYLIPIGLLMYYYNVSAVKDDILEWCKSKLYTNITITDKDCLYDTQYEDLLSLVSYHRGIMQSYTGSGKTQVIGVLVKNLLNDQSGNILVAGPKNMVLDEIKSRLESFGLYTTTYFDPNQRVNCVNPNGICHSNIYKDGEMTEWLKNVKFVIVDEVDKLSNTSIKLLDEVESYGCDNFWGFSATAKKDDANEIPATKQLMSIMNYDLLSVVSKFSHSVVYKVPTDFNIELISVDLGTPDLSYLSDDIGSEAYNHIYGYCTTTKFMKYLRFIMESSKPLVPIYYTTVIDEWVKYFTDKRLIVLCGSGYLLIENGEVVDQLDIESLKYLVSIGDFDAIFTTTSGFAALDCPELRDVVLLSGTSAGSVIQYIGRVARKKDFRIWYATHNKKIPIISRNLSVQLNLVNHYYRYCKIKSTTKYVK